MPELFLLPTISVFDVHDVAVRDWLNMLDDTALSDHLEYPFKLDRFFPESSRRALMGVDEIHDEVMHLIDVINPQAVFLDISIDLVELENRYNKRLISPLEFWSEYYQIPSSMSEPSQAIYHIYIKEIIDKETRFIEREDHLPLSVIFYGQDIKTGEKFIPVYENIRDKDSEFLLQTARAINEITSFRESPNHLWYSPMQIRQTAISYEETEKFYGELLNRIKRFLKFKVRDYIVRNLREQALEFVYAYEEFMEYKIQIDALKFSNILEGLKALVAQSDYPAIAIFCSPMHHPALLSALKNEKKLSEIGITIGDINISTLLTKMRPFIQKNRIMQNNYNIALDIIGRGRPKKYNSHSALLVPT